MEETNELSVNLKFVAKTSMLVFLTIALGKLISYAYRIAIGRYFGPEVYGLFSLAIAILGWFVLFSTLGLTQGLGRYIALYRGKKEVEKIVYIIRRSFNMLLFSGVLLGVILFLTSEIIALRIFHDENLIIFLRFFSVAVPLTVLMNLRFSILVAYEKASVYSVLFNFVQNLFKILLLVLFVYLGFNYKSIIFSHVIAVMGVLFIAWYISRRIIPEIFEDRKIPYAEYKKEGVFKELWNYSWPLVLFGLIESIFLWTDTVMIGYFTDALNVGLYNGAVPIALLLSTAPELFMIVFFPLVTKNYALKKMKLIESISKQTSKWIFIINLPITIFTVFFAEDIIKVFFGSDYLAGALPLRILMIGYLFMTAFNLSSRLIAMTGRTKILLYDMAFFCLVNIILNFLLIPKYGISGAAAATALSIMMMSVVFAFQTNKYLKIIQIDKKIVKIFALSIIPCAALFFVREKIGSLGIVEVLIYSISFMILYLIFLYLAGCFDSHDKEIMLSVKRKIFGKYSSWKNQS